jgi:hypothetical protein
MATLVIHPGEDPSTFFLKPIYSKNTEWKVITSNIIKSELIAEIEKVDNLIFMGHGDVNGLFEKKNSSRYIIGSSFCSLLESKNCLLIWCNADKFVKKNKLSFNGKFTGMFVSEILEMVFINEQLEFEEDIHAYQPMINESNESFAITLGNLLRENDFRDMKYIYESLKKEYGLVAKRNEVAIIIHGYIITMQNEKLPNYS